MVLLPCDIQNRAANLREIYTLPSKLDFTLDKLVLLVKFANPLAKCCPGKRYTIVYPLVHG